MNQTTSLDGIKIRLEELERRVATLERVQTPLDADPQTETIKTAALLPPVQAAQASGFISVLGRAMLGIAGAYLLRAISDSHLVPQVLLAPFAIAYALAWLLVAARSTRSVARVIFACTSVAILAPMLWELTMRFQVLPAWADALALAAMALAATAMVRSVEQNAVLQIAHLSAAALSLLLAIATHNNLPFLAVLLLLVASGEVAAKICRAAAFRAPIALAADMGIWILIYLYRGPHADYPDHQPVWLIAPGFLLFLITAVSLGHTAMTQHERIRVYDILQTVIAFMLACCGLLYFGPPQRLFILGAICLLLAAAAYTILFTAMRRDSDSRNIAVFAVWSAVLLVAGSFFSIPASFRSEWLGLCAVVASALAVRRNLLFLAVHGNVYLLAAVAASGLSAYAWQSLATSPAGPPSFAVVLVILCTVVSYSLAISSGSGFARPTSYVPASIAMLAVAALLAHGLIATVSLGFILGSHLIALIRSLTLCAVALALAFAGSMAHRRELVQLAYAAVVLEVLKLFAEDLRLGHLVYVAASVCLFAITLLLLPSILKRSAA